jgi:hypothetical protein
MGSGGLFRSRSHRRLAPRSGIRENSAVLSLKRLVNRATSADRLATYDQPDMNQAAAGENFSYGRLAVPVIYELYVRVAPKQFEPMRVLSIEPRSG